MSTKLCLVVLKLLPAIIRYTNGWNSFDFKSSLLPSCHPLKRVHHKLFGGFISINRLKLGPILVTLSLKPLTYTQYNNNKITKSMYPTYQILI